MMRALIVDDEIYAREELEAMLNETGEFLVAGKCANALEAMQAIRCKSRDNARTPMQWDDSHNAGFTRGQPWIRVNERYRTINAASALADPGSILHYYRKLIRLRRENLVFVYGDFAPIPVDDEQVFAYVRTLDAERLLVLLNFSTRETGFTLPADVGYTGFDLLISNWPADRTSETHAFLLRPYEARVYRLRQAGL